MTVILTYITVCSLGILFLLWNRKHYLQAKSKLAENEAFERKLASSDTPIGDRLAREMGIELDF